MSKRLILLRHAKSSYRDFGESDHERSLSPRGERDAPTMGKRHAEISVRPSLILTSTAVRARQTARLFAQAIGYPLEFVQSERGLYLAEPDTILEIAGLQDNSFNSIIICGHNPGITELACTLSRTNIDNVPTAGIVILDSAIDAWEQADRTRWSLIEFDYPKKSA